MLKASELFRHGADPFLVCNTKGIDGDSRTEVNIFLSHLIVNERALSRNDLHGETRVSTRDIFAVNILNIQSSVSFRYYY